MKHQIELISKHLSCITEVPNFGLEHIYYVYNERQNHYCIIREKEYLSARVAEWSNALDLSPSPFGSRVRIPPLVKNFSRNITKVISAPISSHILIWLEFRSYKSAMRVQISLGVLYKIAQNCFFNSVVVSSILTGRYYKHARIF